MDTIKIDSGVKRVTIADGDGSIRGEIVFNPKDTLFVEKFYKACSDVANRLQELKPEDESIEKQLEAVKEINVFVRERLDYAFGTGTCQIAFGDTVSYDFDIYTQFIDGIKPYIEPVRAEKVAAYIPQAKKPARGTGRKRTK